MIKNRPLKLSLVEKCLLVSFSVVVSLSIIVFSLYPGPTSAVSLSPGTAIHSHSGTTTGGSTLTRPNISNASAFTLSTGNDVGVAALTTSTTKGRYAFTSLLGTAALYLDPGNQTEAGIYAPVLGNFSDGANLGFELRTNTVDGTDASVVNICPTGACDSAGSRGANVSLYGNEASGQTGSLYLRTGNPAGAIMDLKSGVSGMRIYKDGGILFNSNNPGGTVTFSTLVRSDHACAAGYTRKTPNYCEKNTIALTFFVRNACTTLTFPTDAVVGKVDLVAVAGTNNVVNTVRYSWVEQYTSNTCATSQRFYLARAQGFEFVAQAVSVDIASDTAQRDLNLSSLNAYLLFTDDAGDRGSASYAIVGYYD